MLRVNEVMIQLHGTAKGWIVAGTENRVLHWTENFNIHVCAPILKREFIHLKINPDLSFVRWALLTNKHSKYLSALRPKLTTIHIL